MTTLEHTTQWYRAEGRIPFRRHLKTRFPAANVSRLNETVCTDTFFSDCAAHDDGIPGHGGATMAQLYVGKTSHLTECYPMSSKDQMSKTLLDFINDHSAPNVLFSDNAKEEIGLKVQDILRHYNIKQNMCEPHYQNQNYAERRIQDIKKITNTIMERTGT